MAEQHSEVAETKKQRPARPRQTRPVLSMKTRTEKASTHTAAPWEVRVFPSLLSEQPPFCKIIGAVEGDGVGDDLADVTTNYGVGGRAMAREEWEANARLMGSAPEMLDVLKETLEYWQTTGFADCDPDCDCLVQSVEKVISKAEGRA